jgi:uncharacterized ion transporter superfamily protein YfcC
VAHSSTSICALMPTACIMAWLSTATEKLGTWARLLARITMGWFL